MSAATDLASMDVVADVMAYLRAHSAIAAAGVGGGGVSARNEPPYPHLRVTDPPGTQHRQGWLTITSVQIEVIGDADGSPGKTALSTLYRTVIGALIDLRTAPARPGATCVITSVGEPSGGWSPEPTGQPRYVITTSVAAHPLGT